ncbi:MAG: hypothetical protein VYC17_01945 [Nitrospinota bacterium]|nr:hypothetical protein [Nitrospinota bacterium]
MDQLNLKNWVRDRILFLGLVIFVIGAAGYIGAEKMVGSHSPWIHPIREFSLLISMIGVVSLGYEVFLRELSFKEYKAALEEIVNPDAVRLGIEGIYKNRSELGQAYTFEALFKNVKREIFIGGTSLLSIATSSRELLKEKILNGINVRLLLMDPESQVVDLIIKQGSGTPTFKDEIKTSILLLQKLQDEVKNEHGSKNKGRLQVHTYSIIPSHSFIAVDTDGPHSRGTIVADMGPYLGRQLARPSMVVVNKRNGIYEYWQQLNSTMWEGSKNIRQDNMAKEGSKTLVLVSGPETLCHNGATDAWVPAAICRMNDRWKSIKGSQWVWVRESVTLEEAKTGSQNQFRATFELPSEKVLRGDLFLRSDDVCRLSVNDVGLVQQYGGAEYPDPYIIDISKYLKAGENLINFEVNNFAKPTAETPDDNPTGLIYRLHVQYRE